ncbi:MAG: GtrA family protein [Clostridiales bacterium]|nr:GtrA family protein [Clostridiales bacterium]
MKKLLHQIMKFGVVGGLAFLIDYGLLALLTEVIGLHYLLSGAISFSVSVIFNYICSVLWVFDVDKKRGGARNLGIFLVLSILGLGINQLLMWLLVEGGGIYYLLAKIFATAVVMVYNFITRKLFLERKVEVA